MTYQFLSAAGQLVIFVPVVLLLGPSSAFGIVELPGWLLYLAVCYSLLGSLITHCIGRNLIVINFQQQQFEADFRHSAIHVRDNAESITLYNSEPNEDANLRSRFERIKLAIWLNMAYTKRLGFFTVGYNYAQWLVPFFILAPSFFKGDISLGDLFQLTGALASVNNAFDWFINVYGPLTAWRATCDR